MSMNLYGLDQLRFAVVDLLTGTGVIQERLQRAGEHRLVRITPEDLPLSHQMEFRELYATLTREEPFLFQGRIEATVSEMSDEEASRLAFRIIALWVGVAEALDELELPDEESESGPVANRERVCELSSTCAGPSGR